MAKRAKIRPNFSKLANINKKNLFKILQTSPKTKMSKFSLKVSKICYIQIPAHSKNCRIRPTELPVFNPNGQEVLRGHNNLH